MYNIKICSVETAKAVRECFQQLKEIYAELINERITKELSTYGRARVEFSTSRGSKLAREFIIRAGKDCFEPDVLNNVLQEVVQLYVKAGYKAWSSFCACDIKIKDNNDEE